MKMEKLVLIYNRWSEESGLGGERNKDNPEISCRIRESAVFFFLIENRFSTHIVHPDQFPPPLLPDAPPSPFPKSTPRLYPIRKKADLQDTTAKPNQTKYVKTRQQSSG